MIFIQRDIHSASWIGLYLALDVLLSALCDVQIQGPVLKYYYLSTMMELEKDRYRAGSAYQLVSLAWQMNEMMHDAWCSMEQ